MLVVGGVEARQGLGLGKGSREWQDVGLAKARSIEKRAWYGLALGLTKARAVGFVWSGLGLA